MGQAVLEELKRIIEDSEVSLRPQLQSLSGSIAYVWRSADPCARRRRMPQQHAGAGVLQLQYSWALVATEASSDGLARPTPFQNENPSRTPVPAPPPQIMKEDDNNWPMPDRVGRQELEIVMGQDHISFTTTKLGSLLQVQQSQDPEGLRIFYYLVQVRPLYALCSGCGADFCNGHEVASCQVTCRVK